MNTYERIGKLFLLKQGPPEPPCSDLELELAGIILKTFGGPMLKEANVPRARKVIDALEKAGYTIVKK